MRTLSSIALSLAVAAGAFAQSRTELIAPMTGSGKGKAVFKARGNELEFQAEGENLRPNTTFRLNVGNGKIVANVTTNALGRYAYRRAWRGTSPMIRVGDTSILRSTANAVVQSGTFRVK